eukprot:TRINITY_DN48914_c1_g1_i1.p1 TRINITY_DN48914_c1_g1~~TRINITY_DN48914_c1_g1_i1.p1  ORF type:complete len:883 (-),score=223.96 TRINITY_DN48914_c1_g1_i1:52-2700(-)
MADDVDATSAAALRGSGNVVVATGRGRDRPGICDAFVRVVVDNGCRLMDMAQFLLEGILVFTFVFCLDKQDSMRIIMDLLQCAKATGLVLDFHFPSDEGREGFRSRAQSIAARVDTGIEAVSGARIAVINVVRAGSFTPALFHDIDMVLEEFCCKVDEIEHRSDNKVENNGEISKVTLRVTCPAGLRLSTLYMGAPVPDGAAARGLQRVARDHDTVMTLSWFDGINRPTGKSLVVFQLSQVLVPFELLDAILTEAGLDPGAAEKAESAWQQGRNKVAMLKGHSVDAARKVAENLQLTPGARLVCGALKAMGFRLAILAETGHRDISDKLRQLLGIDYVICQNLQVADGAFTGEYAGEASDVRFRKSDLLKLMAERESIDFQNVIVVGSFLKGLQASHARLMLETFGPNVLFNASQQRDLSLALYLLGFSGSHVRDLRRIHEPCDSSTGRAESAQEEDISLAAGDDGQSTYLISISARKRQPGALRRIFESMAAVKMPEALLRIVTVRQCSLQDGGMCLGLELRCRTGESQPVLKDLLFDCHRHGFQVSLDEQAVQSPSPKGPESCWQHYSQDRHIITLVQRPEINGECLKKIFSFLSSRNVNIVRIERLTVARLAAVQVTVSLPSSIEVADFQAQLGLTSREMGVDVAFQRDNVDRWMRRLVVFDMDSTLIQQEVIDELAKLAGVEDQVKALTESAMRGELNFFESLKARVALLKGHNADELFDKVKANLVFTPGAKKLCQTLKSLGYKMAVISGGFLPVAQEVQKYLGLDYAFANTLEVDEHTGLLTGATSGPVVTPQRKRALLAMIANVEGCEVCQTIAVGDGANDIPMLNTAGLGIAFCAKPKVQAATEFHINHQDLSAVLFLIGLSEHATERLAQEEE